MGFVQVVNKRDLLRRNRQLSQSCYDTASFCPKKTGGEFKHFRLSSGRQNFLRSYFHALRGCWPLPAAFEYKTNSFQRECGAAPLGKWKMKLEVSRKF